MWRAGAGGLRRPGAGATGHSLFGGSWKTPGGASGVRTVLLGRVPCRLAAAALIVGLAVRAAAEPAALPRLGPAPNFALSTHRHDRLWLTQLRDRVVVLTFFCANCPACPEVLPALLELTRALGGEAGRRVFFVAVSVDPGRDTPAALRAFARDRGAEPAAWLFLTGRAAEVDVVTRRYGVEVRRGPRGPSHDCLTVLIDGTGTVRGRYDTPGLARLRADVPALLAE